VNIEGSALPLVAKIKKPIESCVPGVTVHTNYDMIETVKPQEASGEVLFTYDVYWKENLDLKWASRWDVHLTMDNQIPAKVHWLQISKSLVVLYGLSAMLAAVLAHNLRSNDTTSESAGADESCKRFGWRLVHADFFRAPLFSPMLLAVCCGTGAQLVCTALVVICAACLGYLSPAQRGYLLLGILSIYSLSGVLNGYVATRLYMTFKGARLQDLTIATSLAFPGLICFIFLLVNLVAYFNASTLAAPWYAIFTLTFGWLGILVPLVYVGANLGHQHGTLVFPLTISKIPRQIPRQPLHRNSLMDSAISGFLHSLVAGFLPFLAICVEQYYILSSLWSGYYYYEYGFLLLVTLIVFLTCAEVSILMTYFRLNSEDYRWWWHSFCNGGSMGMFVFGYSFIYYQQLEAFSLSAFIVYFGCMALFSIALFAMLGFVGLAASLWFSMNLFSSIMIQ
jgi:transmembrane 9 superfamily member 2/4